ncbi:MAG TPA: hypothetical protein VMT34_03755, partial [Aggregatilineales bacterium]|nr:hypothetical protein [Aggregatilineales bacterium]
MKRLLSLAVLFFVVFSLGQLSTSAQDAPKGTWLGSWPYVLPPDHNLNGWASNGLNDNLGVMFRSFVHLPFAIFHWADNTYEGLLAEKRG